MFQSQDAAGRSVYCIVLLVGLQKYIIIIIIIIIIVIVIITIIIFRFSGLGVNIDPAGTGGGQSG